MKPFLNFVKRLFDYRSVIAMMALQEIRNRYVGTLAGLVWTIINPLSMVVIYTFVFSYMLKAQPVGNVPYLAYFFSGLAPWMTFSDTIIASTNTISNQAYLTKKMIFPTEILPIVSLAANLLTHGILLVILCAILAVTGISFSPFNLQCMYYLVALCVFATGLAWLLSSVSVFFRDTPMIVGVIMNIWLWLTPIIWLMELLPPGYPDVIRLNPMYYIVDGYRRSFIYHLPFWENYGLGAYYWAVSLAMLLVGGMVFRKLKPDFADVL